MSERHACRLVGQWRATQRYQPMHRTDEDALTEAIIQLASEYGRYGYRRITALLQEAGWYVGKDRVQRIWRREGLKVPQKQRPRGRFVAERRLLCAVATRASKPRVELRFRERKNSRRENHSHDCAALMCSNLLYFSAVAGVESTQRER